MTEPPDLARRAELAEALVFDGDRVLLVRRRDVPVWTLPGGHRDPGETAAASCEREVREETGLAVRAVRLLGWYRRPWWLSGGRAAVYQCDPVGGVLQPGRHEAEAAFWPVAALPVPILHWYPPIIGAAVERREERSAAAARGFPAPRLAEFLRHVARAPQLWLPLSRHVMRMYVTSRLAQHHARRR